jgi:hypothetical protein
MIAERYRLEERIGAGGMGEVWRATDTKLRRTVALKRSHDHVRDGQIRREAIIAAGVPHPNVVTVFDTEVDDGTKWLVMEYLPARSLREVLHTDGPLSPEATAAIGAQIAAALAAMHDERMVHRDVTPANVLVTPDNVAKLTDFGISHWDAATLTSDDQVLGTAAYMAPEVASGGDARRAADVFSLGATLYAAVEGHSPWGDSGENPEVLRRRATAGRQRPVTRAGALAPVLAELMRADPAVRPSALDAKRMLEDVYGGTVPVIPLSLAATPTTDPAATPRWRRTGVLVGVLTAAVLAAGAVIYLNRDDQDTKAPSAAAGAVLDISTADPCAVLDKSALSRFGTGATVVDPDYGLFSQCSMTVRLTPADDDLGHVALYLERIPEYEAANHPLGRLGPIEKPDEKDDGHCERTIPLPDGNRVRIDAYNQGARVAEPCDMAQAVADRTFAALRAGPIPRREKPFPRSSLAHADACDMLDATELQAVMAANPPAPEAELGNWTCYWDFGTQEVTVEFGREWREPPGDDEKPVMVGTRTAVQDADDHACSISINGREYTAVNAGNNDWVEIATVTLDTDNEDAGSALCDRVNLLAVAVGTHMPTD